MLIDVVRLKGKAGAEEIIEDDLQLGVGFEVANMFFSNGMLDGAEVGLQFGVNLTFHDYESQFYN